MFSLQHGLIYFLSGLLVMFLLMRGCSEPEGGDTVYVRGATQTDTVLLTKTVYKDKLVPYYVEATTKSLPDTVRANHCDSVRAYRNAVDSAGVHIDVTSTVQGVLLSQGVTYSIPQVSTHRTDTLRITGRQYRYGLSVLTDGRGLEVVGSYAVSRNVAVMGSYDVQGKAVRLGAGVRF